MRARTPEERVNQDGAFRRRESEAHSWRRVRESATEKMWRCQDWALTLGADRGNLKNRCRTSRIEIRQAMARIKDSITKDETWPQITYTDQESDDAKMRTGKRTRLQKNTVGQGAASKSNTVNKNTSFRNRSFRFTPRTRGKLDSTHNIQNRIFPLRINNIVANPIRSPFSFPLLIGTKI
jgi:hypothetical protein